jgi:hypothetical protein
MRRRLVALAALVAAAVSLSACVVGPGRPGCAWVAPHYGEFGVFHPGHCR